MTTGLQERRSGQTRHANPTPDLEFRTIEEGETILQEMACALASPSGNFGPLAQTFTEGLLRARNGEAGKLHVNGAEDQLRKAECAIAPWSNKSRPSPSWPRSTAA